MKRYRNLSKEGLYSVKRGKMMYFGSVMFPGQYHILAAFMAVGHSCFFIPSGIGDKE